MNETSETHRTHDSVRGRRVAAAVLLLVAAFALLRDYIPISAREGGVALLGVGFIVWAGVARTAGLLIPGGILVGVGAGIVLRQELGSAAFLFSMAGGFLLIPLLSSIMFRQARNFLWTVFPAGGIALAGLVQVGGREVRVLLREIGPFWPYVLIVVALWLFFVKPRDRERGGSGPV